MLMQFNTLATWVLAERGIAGAFEGAAREHVDAAEQVGRALVLQDADVDVVQPQSAGAGALGDIDLARAEGRVGCPGIGAVGRIDLDEAARDMGYAGVLAGNDGRILCVGQQQRARAGLLETACARVIRLRALWPKGDRAGGGTLIMGKC